MTQSLTKPQQFLSDLKDMKQAGCFEITDDDFMHLFVAKTDLNWCKRSLIEDGFLEVEGGDMYITKVGYDLLKDV